MGDILKQILIINSTKEVVAFGFTDLEQFSGKAPIETYPSYNETTYSIIHDDLPDGSPGDLTTPIYWDSTNKEYTETQPS